MALCCLLSDSPLKFFSEYPNKPGQEQMAALLPSLQHIPNFDHAAFFAEADSIF